MLKEEVLKNLSDWCLDPFWQILPSKDLKDKVFKNVNDYYCYYIFDNSNDLKHKHPSDDLITNKEIEEAILNEIKTNPWDWKIKQEGELTVAIHNSGRKVWKDCWASGDNEVKHDKKWKEIEEVINNPPPKKEKKPEKKPIINQNSQPNNFLLCLLISLGLLVILLVLATLKKRKRRRITSRL